MRVEAASKLESHAFACLAFGVIGDAMGTPTENLEPAQIEGAVWLGRFIRR